MSSPQIAIVTPSYHRDFDRCRLMVQSFDRYASADLHHYLVIDRRDLGMFKVFANDRRTVLAAEDLLPWWIFRLPRVPKVWFSLKTMPVRGWIVQQLLKLAVPTQIDADVYCFMDSDVAFLRPTDTSVFIQGDAVRLFRRPDHANLPTHRRWHRTAARLLGLEEREYFGSDYIGNMITWRREHLLQMHDHIEQVTGKQWLRAVASELHLAEYILYGVFVEHVLGLDASGHYFDAQDLCHCSWDYRFGGPEDIDRFFERDLAPRICAVQVQSNLKLPADSYAQRICRLQDRLDSGRVSA